MQRSLAIVIPAAPGSPWLNGAVEAVLADGAEAIFVVSEQPPAELIWAGGTTHGSWVPVGEQAGFGERANRGIAAADNDGYQRILLLNDDTRLRPGCLSALDACLGEAKERIVGAVLEDWSQTSVQLSGIEVFPASARIRVQRDDPGAEHLPRAAVSAAAMMFDIPTWSRLGGFCEAFSFYFEDIDFCHRLLERGGEVVICGPARVQHRGGGTQSHRASDTAWHATRSQILFAKRLGGGLLNRSRRALCATALGLAWSARNLGPPGLAWSARGAISGLLWSENR